MVKTQAGQVVGTNMDGGSGQFLPARRVWERYGVSEMSIHRWLRDPRMNFPQPFYFGRFRYWRLGDLEAWERQRATSRDAA